MLDSVKEILTKEIDTADIKALMKTEVDLKKFIQMEVEINKLKELLATEIKLKEFLLTEINIKDLLFSNATHEEIDNHKVKASSEANRKKIAEPAVTPKKKSIKPKTRQSRPQKPVIPATKRRLPPYLYGLTTQLRDDHKEMISIYDSLMMAAKKRDFPLTKKELAKFSVLVRRHYQMADVDLYTYLKIYIQRTYPKRERAFNELSLEMKNISIEIFYSLSQSPNLPLTNKTYNAFMAEFEILGDHLINRIKREERVLFDMYEESHQATEISQ